MAFQIISSGPTIMGLVTADTKSPAPQPVHSGWWRGAFAPDPATGTEAGPGPTTPRRSAVRRASWLRGRCHASQAWHRALLARRDQGWTPRALRQSPRSGIGSDEGEKEEERTRTQNEPGLKKRRKRFVGRVERLRETHRRRCPRWASDGLRCRSTHPTRDIAGECENLGAATRSGTKKTALFDIVNRKRRGARHRQGAGAPSRQRQRARVPAERASRRALFRKGTRRRHAGATIPPRPCARRPRPPRP
jgi:hypothetical protein